MTTTGAPGEERPMMSTALEFGPNDRFVQERYEEFLADPKNVDPIWREYLGTNGFGVADSTSGTVN
jgi:2-oxoglutarate decarboxylase